jgi:SNF2 family DNA or RNA helicase
VTVRQRRYVVTGVTASALPPAQGEPNHHLLELASVEDEGLGEQLRVVWELEPGRTIVEHANLPDPKRGFESPERLEALLHAVRWGAISSADIQALHAPFRAGITLEDYQLDPVARAILMPRVSLLVADDVGLGKTIEAGLVVQELMLRHRARTVLVVCPASLQLQWRDQMRDKFGLEFRIVDSELLRELRRNRGLHVNPWSHFPRLITSIDFLKREQPQRLFRELLPAAGQPAFPRRFDLLIVDEAHNVAPAGRQQSGSDSMRTAAIRELAPHFEHKLFLTATPHNGYKESFRSLLELLDDQRFHRGVDPDPLQLRAIMVRRLKRELTGWDGSPRFAARRIESLEVDYTQQEREAHGWLNAYAASRRAAAAEEPAAGFATEFVLKLLKKRLFSSPAAFLSTLEKHEASLSTARRAQRSSTPKTSGQLLRRLAEGLDQEHADDAEHEEEVEGAVDATSRLFAELSATEKQLLANLKQWAEKASATADRKAEALVAFLRRTVKPGGRWSHERVIVFTEYRATQNWLLDVLHKAGFVEGERVMTLYGGMDRDEREAIKAAFQAAPDESDVRILLATDAASEGIDLQNHCHLLVHYEIPWNPNRLEQRNGRIDRHGQRAPEVFVHHFVGKGWDEKRSLELPPGALEGDLEFLMRAVLKVEAIREDLGTSGDVIATQVEEAMRGKRKRLEVDTADKRSAEARKWLKRELNVREQLQKLKETVTHSARALDIEPDTIRRVVEVGLALAGQPPLTPIAFKDLGTTRGQGTSPVYRLGVLSGAWASAKEGLLHPHSKEQRPIVFDGHLAAGRDDVVLIHLNHRLVQMCLGLLRAEVWNEGRTSALRRITARIVPSRFLDKPAAVAHARLVVLGADNTKLHEELVLAGGTLSGEKLVPMSDARIQEALEGATDEEAPESFRKRVTELWPNYRKALLERLEDRQERRVSELKRKLAERAEREVTDVTAILEELRRTISAELRKDDTQLGLFDAEDRAAFERNRSPMEQRLARIPEDIRRETEAIRQRYAEPSSRLFPVAITLLFPDSLTGGAR